MPGDVLDQVLTKVNKNLRANGCSILLCMDNVGCNPGDLQHKYTNIRIMHISL